MIPSSFVKQAWEERYCVFDLTDTMTEGDTIDSIDSVSVLSLTGTDLSGTMVGATAVSTDRLKVTAIIKGGTAGTTYWVRVRVVAASGDKIEDDLKLIVKSIGG